MRRSHWPESLKLASLKYICEAGTWFRHRS